MKISDFIDQLNQNLPSLEQIAAKRAKLNLRSDLSELAVSLENLKYRHSKSPNRGETLRELIEDSNIHQMGIGLLDFYSEIKVRSGDMVGLEFAKHNDFYRISLSLQNGSIFWCNDESTDVEILAANFDQFLSFLLLYHRYFMHVIQE